MAFYVNNQCVDSAQKALSIFQSEYPKQIGNDMYSLGVHDITDSGLITYQILNSQNTVAITGSSQLITCELPDETQKQELISDYFMMLLILFFVPFFARKAIRFFTRFLGGFSSDL